METPSPATREFNFTPVNVGPMGRSSVPLNPDGDFSFDNFPPQPYHMPKMPIRSGTGFGNYEFPHKFTLDDRDAGIEGVVRKPSQKMLGNLKDVFHVIKEVPSYKEIGKNYRMFESKLRPGKTDGHNVSIESPTPVKRHLSTSQLNKSDTKNAVGTKRFSDLTRSIDGSRFYCRHSLLDGNNGSRRRIMIGKFCLVKKIR
jgi:hypothetical protein